MHRPASQQPNSQFAPEQVPRPASIPPLPPPEPPAPPPEPPEPPPAPPVHPTPGLQVELIGPCEQSWQSGRPSASKQAVVDCCARPTHAPRLQHAGEGHDLSVQLQKLNEPPMPPSAPPVEHCWPGLHWGWVPQRHSWFTHESATPPSVQFTHALPPEPHAPVVLPSRHWLPSQHPEGHDIESQTHAVPLQRVPAGHGAPVAPHWHPPADVHALLVTALHVVHEPPLPQLGKSWALQVLPPLQHCCGGQPGQPAHVPLVHAAPPQLAHATPPEPQYIDPPPTRHWLGLELSQQPRQVRGSHTHTPPEQIVPWAHGPPVPQPQRPPLHDGAWPPHDRHMPASAPHDAGVLPARQRDGDCWLQQPGHDESQTQRAARPVPVHVSPG